MRKIIVSAPGKIHLLGEHAVVYGKPALLAAIALYVTVTISASTRTKIEFREHKREGELLKRILENAIKRKYRFKTIPPYKISVSSNLPIGFGLGSSAAISAAFAGALLSFLKIPHNKKLIFDIAFEGEKLFHGNPSGGDLAAVIEGGFLWFRKEFEFLKTFSPLPFKPHKDIKQFILVNSGKPVETTREMVGKVAELKKRFSARVDKIFNHQEQLTKELALALKDGNEDLLIECIKQGERNLEELGVVGKKAQKLIREIENNGGAVKIMGGGGVKKGSGMLLTYHTDRDRIENYLRKKGIKIFSIAIDEEGLQIHE